MRGLLVHLLFVPIGIALVSRLVYNNVEPRAWPIPHVLSDCGSVTDKISA